MVVVVVVVVAVVVGAGGGDGPPRATRGPAGYGVEAPTGRATAASTGPVRQATGRAARPLLAQATVTASSLAAGASKTVAKSILEGSPL